MSAVKFQQLGTETIQQLMYASTATVTMQLMKRGLRTMAINLQPVNPSATRMVGPAYTLRYIPAREDIDLPPKPSDPENAQKHAVENAPPGSVLVVSTGPELRSGTFGDILVARMQVRGVAGIVSDGAMRDVPVVSNMKLPVFSACAAAPPSMTTLHPVDVQQPIGCGGVPVYQRRHRLGCRRRGGDSAPHGRRGGARLLRAGTAGEVRGDTRQAGSHDPRSLSAQRREQGAVPEVGRGRRA